MKKRKFGVYALAALIIVSGLGVGYAALTGSLQINGSATLTKDNSNFVVHFTGTPTGTKTTACSDCSTAAADGGDISIDGSDDKVANLVIKGFKKVGDKYTGTFTVTNDSPNAGTTAYVTASAQMKGTNASYFTITTDWGSTEKTIAKGSSQTLSVSVELNQLYTGNDSTLSADLEVTLSASTVSSGS